MIMETSKRGIELIKSFEGLRLKAYKPVKTEKYWTIGYGHYGRDVVQNMTITEERAEELLRQDLMKFEHAVNRVVGVIELKMATLKQCQFDALVSFCYNVGVANFESSTLRRKVIWNNEDKSIRDEFMRWCYSGKVRLKGLEKRRKAEADMYFSEE